MDVLYSEYVVVWGSIRLPKKKIQNGRWTYLNLIYQEDPGVIKEQPTRLVRILYINDITDDLEQEVN